MYRRMSTRIPNPAGSRQKSAANGRIGFTTGSPPRLNPTPAISPMSVRPSRRAFASSSADQLAFANHNVVHPQQTADRHLTW